MKDELVIDPLDAAIHKTVHNYKNPHSGKKGAVGIAPVIGMRPGTVQNKANPSEEYAEFGAKELRKVMMAANDFEPLKQLNIDCGFFAVPFPHIEFPADMDVLDAHLDFANEFGEVAIEIKKALEDGNLTSTEMTKIKKEFNDVCEKGQSLMIVLQGMCEPEGNVTQINKVKS